MSETKDRDLQESAAKAAGKIPLIVTAVATALIAAISLFVLFFVNPMNWAWEMEVRTSVIETKVDNTNENLSKLVETVDKMAEIMLDLQIRVSNLEEKVTNLEEGQKELRDGQKELRDGQKELVGRFDSLEANIGILLANSSQAKPSSLSLANQ